jgi:hypothetical protein
MARPRDKVVPMGLPVNGNAAKAFSGAAVGIVDPPPFGAPVGSGWKCRVKNSRPPNLCLMGSGVRVPLADLP